MNGEIHSTRHDDWSKDGLCEVLVLNNSGEADVCGYQKAVRRYRGPHVETYSGRPFYIFNPKKKDIFYQDIAHGLSLLCRYNGATRKFYSVAEHSINVSYAVPKEDALWGLLHDAAEAYIGDMVRPLKKHIPEFSRIEDDILKAVAEKYGLPEDIPKSVIEADTRILFDEREYLMQKRTSTSIKWDIDKTELRPLGIAISGYKPELVEKIFNSRLRELVFANHSKKSPRELGR